MAWQYSLQEFDVTADKVIRNHQSSILFIETIVKQDFAGITDGMKVGGVLLQSFTLTYYEATVTHICVLCRITEVDR